jgi:hypothetical protein
MYAAVLAILVPAEAAVCNFFRSKILKCAQKHISFRHFKFTISNANLNQFIEGAKERPGIGHAEILAKKSGCVEQPPNRPEVLSHGDRA